MSAAAQFAGGIAPATLLEQVAQAAPFLAQRDFSARAPATDTAKLTAHPFGWLGLIRNGAALPAVAQPTPEQRSDYFALCLACHHATVASYCPTDVDSKIRGHCWQHPSNAAYAAQIAVAEASLHWESACISARWEASASGPVGGHHGEWLGVMMGALGICLRLGDDASVARLQASVVDELEREAAAFRAIAEQVRSGRGDEVALLRLAAILTHNVGDVDQGLSYWPDDVGTDVRARVQRLAHENRAPFAGTFQVAALLYRTLLAAEGHRHYPLRTVKALRTSPDLLLPLGPCFDDWGRRIATHDGLKIDERAEVLAALLDGCRKVANQAGYFRAIAGIADAISLDELARRLSSGARNALKDADLRRKIAVKQHSFESTLRKQTQALLRTIPRG